jgi:hypothetical protein
MTITIADRVIDFLGNLQGMDRLQSLIEEPRKAVIDLNTAAIIEADPEFPAGEMLVYESANGVRSRVHTHKLIEQLFVRHAYELSITEGGTVKDQYLHISEHFPIKTGFGQ